VICVTYLLIFCGACVRCCVVLVVFEVLFVVCDWLVLNVCISICIQG